MKPILIVNCLLVALHLAPARAAEDGGLPRKQPSYLTIIREEVKTGRAAAHARHEAGWPAALEKSKSKDYYLALTSMTGPSEAWYLIPSESFTQMGAAMKRDEADPVLSAEIDRLSLADAEFVSKVTSLLTVARPDLGMGEFPDLAKARFFMVSLYRTHPGKDMLFVEIAKAYIQARKRVAPNSSARVYQVIAGAPGPLFVVMTSFEAYGDLDKDMADSMATFKDATQAEQAAFAKWGDAVVHEESQIFRVDPVQSYVPKEVRGRDPAFWMPK